jgi:hypothetical protein
MQTATLQRLLSSGAMRLKIRYQFCFLMECGKQDEDSTDNYGQRDGSRNQRPKPRRSAKYPCFRMRGTERALWQDKDICPALRASNDLMQPAPLTMNEMAGWTLDREWDVVFQPIRSGR